LNKQKIREKDKFLVQWKGFITKGDTWESCKNLKNAGELLRKFEKEYRRNN